MPANPLAPDRTAGSGLAGSTAVVVLLAIVALYFGRDILVPFALAVLLSFLLAPPLSWLRRLRVPRVAAVLIVVTFAFALIGALGMLVGNQVVQLAENLPSYQYTMQAKIGAMRDAAPGGGVVDRLIGLFQSLGNELSAPAAPEAGETAETAEPAPVPVQIASVDRPPLEVIRTVLGPLLGPVGTAGIVIVFVIFILLERDDLRDRFIRLAGQDMHRTTGALAEAAQRVSRYLLMQLVVNATYGVPIGVGLYLIGVPNAFLWGLLATLLRFVPYLGPFIAALFPLTLAFVVDPGWDMLLWTVALLVVMELISNNFVEPWLYGSSTGLSPVAVIFAAIFWTTLWGPIGLILATPLTVCLVVMGRYVPQFEFLGVLLGADPVLKPEERLYHRFLAGATEEAVDIAEAAAVDAASLLTFYDEVALPALRLAADDRHRGVASAADEKRTADGARAIVRELREQVDGEPEAGADGSPVRWIGTPVLCIAGRGELDDAAAAMLAHGLESRGMGSRCLPAATVTPDAIGNLDLAGAEVVCLSYLEPAPLAFARFVCRRLKRRAPHLKVVLGLWNLAAEGTTDRFAARAGAEAAVTGLAEAVERIEILVGQPAVRAMVPPPVPQAERDRLRALESSGMLEPHNRARLDAVARKVADAFDAPIALVSLIDESCQLWAGAKGLPAELDAARESPRETSVCGHLVAAEAPLVVEDAARDPRFAGNPFLREHGIRFYAGAPLRTADGHVIGSLCIIDTKPRTIAPRDLKLLQIIADELVADVRRETDAPAGRAAAAASGPAQPRASALT